MRPFAVCKRQLQCRTDLPLLDGITRRFSLMSLKLWAPNESGKFMEIINSSRVLTRTFHSNCSDQTVHLDFSTWEPWDSAWSSRWFEGQPNNSEVILAASLLVSGYKLEFPICNPNFSVPDWNHPFRHLLINPNFIWKSHFRLLVFSVENDSFVLKCLGILPSPRLTLWVISVAFLQNLNSSTGFWSPTRSL